MRHPGVRHTGPKKAASITSITSLKSMCTNALQRSASPRKPEKIGPKTVNLGAKRR